MYIVFSLVMKNGYTTIISKWAKPGPSIMIDSKANYLRIEAHTRYLMKSAGCGVVWAVSSCGTEYWRKNYPKSRHGKIILQHNNARSHVARSLKTYLEMLKWISLSLSAYYPDIFLLDYHLFLSMTHGLCEQRFLWE